MTELSWQASEAIASWRRVLDQTRGDKRNNFGRAAIELLRLAEKEPPATRLAIIDEVAAIGAAAAIDTDEAQAIMAAAIEAPADHHFNGTAWRGADEKPIEPADRPPLRFADIAAWAAQEPSPREWAVPDRFPLRNVALLTGEGSVGKSILKLQLATAHVLGRDWLGTLPTPGPVLYLNAEDDEAELHRRLAAIAAHYGEPLTALKDLHVLPLAGQDAVLGHADRGGLVKPTPLFHQLTDAARTIQPKLIGLDTSADIFAGNENDRSQVRQFIGLLRGLAIAANAAVIVTAHPSLTGLNSGSGLSGSTAWHNSVRARAYLHTINTADGAEPDRTLRRLDFMKSNYSATAESVTLRWRDGVFVPEAKPGSLEKIATEAKADDTFLTLLDRFTRQGRNVSATKTSPTFAPAAFAGEPEAGGLDKSALAGAMRRLFAANKIRVETYGKPSRPYSRIARCN